MNKKKKLPHSKLFQLFQQPLVLTQWTSTDHSKYSGRRKWRRRKHASTSSAERIVQFGRQHSIVVFEFEFGSSIAITVRQQQPSISFPTSTRSTSGRLNFAKLISKMSIRTTQKTIIWPKVIIRLLVVTAHRNTLKARASDHHSHTRSSSSGNNFCLFLTVSSSAFFFLFFMFIDSLCHLWTRTCPVRTFGLSAFCYISSLSPLDCHFSPNSFLFALFHCSQSFDAPTTELKLKHFLDYTFLSFVSFFISNNFRFGRFFAAVTKFVVNLSRFFPSFVCVERVHLTSTYSFSFRSHSVHFHSL